MVSPAFVYTAAVRQIAERVTYGRQIIEQPRRTRRASEFKQKVNRQRSLVGTRRPRR